MIKKIILLFFLLTPKHAQDFIENLEVTGKIALETKDIEKIQGV